MSFDSAVFDDCIKDMAPSEFMKLDRMAYQILNRWGGLCTGTIPRPGQMPIKQLVQWITEADAILKCSTVEAFIEKWVDLTHDEIIGDVDSPRSVDDPMSDTDSLRDFIVEDTMQGDDEYLPKPKRARTLRPRTPGPEEWGDIDSRAHEKMVIDLTACDDDEPHAQPEEEYVPPVLTQEIPVVTPVSPIIPVSLRFDN